MKQNLNLLWLGLMALLISACNLPTSNLTGAVPRIWIDSPLNNASLPLAGINIVSHANDTASIKLVELSINGTAIRTDANFDASDTLIVMSQPWVPPQTGNYTLQVRAQNKSGAWSNPATVNITVQENAVVPIFTPIPTLQSASTLIFEPPLTVLSTAMPPALIAPPNFVSDPSWTTDVFYNAEGCGPTGVVIEQKIENAASATLYFTVLPSSGSVAMQQVNPNTWQATVNNTDIPDYSNSTGRFRFYMIATNTSDSVQGVEYLIAFGNCTP
jgi:hypothetical protein